MLREAMSCRGTVTHIRRGPKRHVFRYPVWMLYVPLERVGAVAGLCARWLASTDRGHLMTTEQVREKLASAGVAQVHTADLRCFALTQPRSLGFSFNPVNFYFCFAGERLAALLAHVNNTPWDERHCYVLLPRTTKTRIGHPRSRMGQPCSPSRMGQPCSRIGQPRVPFPPSVSTSLRSCRWRAATCCVSR